MQKTDLDLVYRFKLNKDNKFSLLESVKKIIAEYISDFNDPILSLQYLCDFYLNKENIKNNCKDVFDSIKNTDLKEYMETIIKSKDFDEYYMTKYGMKRDELLEYNRIRSVSEENDDFDYEKSSLELTDDLLYVLSNFDQKKHYRDIMSIFVEATLGGIISRLIYEKLYGKVTLFKEIQNEIYNFRNLFEKEYNLHFDPIIIQLFEMFM